MAYTEKKRSMFLGLPWTFTTYKITEELITVKEGLLRKTENDCYMNGFWVWEPYIALAVM